MQKALYRRNHSGFTLLEVASVVTITLLVLTMIFAIRHYAESTEKALESQSHLQAVVRNAEALISTVIRDSSQVTVQADGHGFSAGQRGATNTSAVWEASTRILTVVVPNTKGGSVVYTFDSISDFRVSPGGGPKGVVYTVTITAADGKQSFTDIFSTAPRVPPPSGTQ